VSGAGPRGCGLGHASLCRQAPGPPAWKRLFITHSPAFRPYSPVVVVAAGVAGDAWRNARERPNAGKRLRAIVVRTAAAWQPAVFRQRLFAVVVAPASWHRAGELRHRLAATVGANAKISGDKPTERRRILLRRRGTPGGAAPQNQNADCDESHYANAPSRLLKNAIVAFSNLAKRGAKLHAARKITTCVVILPSHPCDDAARLVFQQAARRLLRPQ